MAEFVLGGIQRAVATKGGRRSSSCYHPVTMSTITAGLERVVCEVCGHMSLRNLRSLTGSIQRERFARPADGIGVTHKSTVTHIDLRQPTAVFALEERLGVRGRYETHPERAAVPA